jgi:hypothetical protein
MSQPTPLPIHVRFPLGSINGKSIGRMSFGFTVDAPENTSVMVRNALFNLFTEVTLGRRRAYRDVIVLEENQ